MATLILTRADLRELLNMAEVLEALEQVFRDYTEGKAAMPPKAYVSLDKGDFRAMPAYASGAVGLKWVNVHPQNPAQGLPTVMATLIYSDPDTGYPLAVMDATEITAYRTGAAAALAAKYLARRDSHILGLIGAGRQAHTQLQAHAEVFDLTSVRVYDRSPEAVRRFISSFPQHRVEGCTLEQVAASDIVCTLTPAREPVLRRELVRPGTHINAIGADAEGKQELEPLILKEALVVVDDLVQASRAGEINVPLSKGQLTMEDIYGTLGEIILGRKPGRNDAETITVFDSTGLAIEDVAAARLVYEKAKQKGKYLSLDLI